MSSAYDKDIETRSSYNFYGGGGDDLLRNVCSEDGQDDARVTYDES
jgi:hypothetical protein